MKYLIATISYSQKKFPNSQKKHFHEADVSIDFPNFDKKH